MELGFNKPGKWPKLLKLILLFVLAIAVGFGGYKGWSLYGNDIKKFIDKKTSSEDALVRDDAMALCDILFKVREIDYHDLAYSLDALREYKNDASKLEHLPANIKDASSFLFDNYIDSVSNLLETVDYCENTVTYLKMILNEDVSNYDAMSENYNELISNIDYILNDMDKVKAPLIFKDVNERFRELISLYTSSVDKLANSMTTGEPLTNDSAFAFANNWVGQMSNTIHVFNDILTFSNDIYNKRVEYLKSVNLEITKACKLSPDKMSAYEFETMEEPPLNVDYQFAQEIYPSLFNSYKYMGVVYCYQLYGEGDYVLEVQIDGFSELYKQTVHVDAEGRYIPIKLVADTGADLLSDRKVPLSVKMYPVDCSSEYCNTSTNIQIKSKNEFIFLDNEYIFSDRYNVLCYMDPSSSVATALKRNAIDILSEITDGKINAFYGYQGPCIDKETDTYYYIESLLIALSDAGITVNDDYVDIHATSYVIQYPEEVMDSKNGNSLDVALVLAGALQSADMDTYLAFSKGKAYVLVETWKDSKEYYIIDLTKLTNDRSRYNPDSFSVNGKGKDTMYFDSPINYVNYSFLGEFFINHQYSILDCSNSYELGISPFIH